MGDSLNGRIPSEKDVSTADARTDILRPSFSSSVNRLPPPMVTFNRLELNEILRCYGRGVADGEWRDYALDFMADRAVFSIFKRSSETPLYKVEKDPRLANKQGAYLVTASGGQVIRRGHDLSRVLSVLERRIKLVRP
jgi:hypothetical protein